MFSMLDVDGNGTIDFDEFKSGVKREPLLVQAFLAPVQQGSLGAAPATRKRSSVNNALLDKKAAGRTDVSASTGNRNTCQVAVSSSYGVCENTRENTRNADEKEGPAAVTTPSSPVER